MADPVSTLPLRAPFASPWKGPVVIGIGALVVLAICSVAMPTFLVNNLIRAFLYAAVALTVDLLWGYTGILTFGQSAFFGIGAYAAGLIFTHVGFSLPFAAAALAAGVGVVAGRGLARVLPRGFAALCIGGDVGVADRPRAGCLFGRRIHRIEQRLVRFRQFRYFRRSMVLYHRRAPDPARGHRMAVRAQRCRSPAGGDTRKRGALRVSRHQRVASQGPADGHGRCHCRVRGVPVCLRANGGGAGICGLRVRHGIGDLGGARRTRFADRADHRHDAD